MAIDLLTYPKERLNYPTKVGEKLVWRIPDDRDYIRYMQVELLKNKKLALSFDYNLYLKDEVKETLSGARFDFPTKTWTVDYNARTRFVMDYLANGDLLDRYDCDLEPVSYNRGDILRDHQKMLVSHWATRRRCFWLAEMGVGKTLAGIECLEWIKKNFPTWGPRNDEDKFWISGPDSALRAWRSELPKWKCSVKPKLITIDSLAKAIKAAKVPPICLLVDESSKVKNINAARTKVALGVSNEMEMFWGMGTFALLMTGTAQPKSIMDLYSQCEIARPGYLREKNIHVFKSRIAMIESREGQYGAYNALLGVKDGTCSVCSTGVQYHGKEAEPRSEKMVRDGVFACPIYTPRLKCYNCSSYHTSKNGCGMFEPYGKTVETNEVSELAARTQGLTVSLRKKDCLDLPEKEYVDVYCTPSAEMYEAAELVMAQELSTMPLINKLRQFSDGFLYNKEEGTYTEMPENPKKQALNQLLDQFKDAEETRVIVYGGFLASLDLIQDACIKAGFNVIRVDGKGWSCKRAEACHLEATQDFFVNAPSKQRIAFVGNPASCGMGLNLQVAKYMVYYSNGFSGEARIQSEDRAHRQGMRESLTIYDIFCLGTDVLVRDNLLKKKDAQDITMQEIKHFNKRIR